MATLREKLGDFEILRRIGSGGMAEVFLADKPGAGGTSKRVVVKRILPDQQLDPRLRAMFVREAQLATRLTHPNVVQVFELVEHPTDGLLLAMEHVDGVDLGRVLSGVKARGESIPPYVAALIAREVSKGLHYAHERCDDEGTPLEIVHRDISPTNILLSRDGAVKIADLGIATARLYRDATTGVKGKLRYMAPEQAEGATLDRRADIYGLGVVLYEMLRLTSPYGPREGAALLRAVRAGRMNPPLHALTDLPADLLAILERAMVTARDQRYATARELADELSLCLVSQGRVIDEKTIEALVRPALTAEGPAVPTTPDVPLCDKVTRPLAAGSVVGRYVIAERLGRGGMADVYAAEDTTLKRRVALKILRGSTSHDARERLLREARLAATFEHPSSVVVFDIGEANGLSFIAMELVRGRTLSSFVGDAGVPIARRVRWLVSAARVLAAAHDKGLVHRDVKPSNLMIREDGEVKVLDFGLARVRATDAAPGAEVSSTAEGAVVGTLRYAAPERFSGEHVDGRADQFSWGVTAWELLAGSHPFSRDDNLDVVGQVLLEGVGPLGSAAPQVPEQIARVVDRALCRDPHDRFASLSQVADALDPWAEATSRSSLHPLTPPRPARARRWALVAAGLAAAALVAVGAWRVLRPAPAPPPAPIVAALACSDASMDGGGAGLGRALGVGACARLGTELGVDWAVTGAPHRLDVAVKLRPGSAAVALRMDSYVATASAATPMAAVVAAVGSLAPRLRTPAWSDERVKQLGARDEASARRIQRVWRRHALGLSPDIPAEVQRLLETDADSPIPHLLALMTSSGGREAIDAGPERVRARLDRLTPVRATVVRALLSLFPAEQDRSEGVRLLREAYAAAPDDPTVAALYAVLATRLGLPEAFAVVERLHERAPTYALGPLEDAVTRAPHPDPARDARYVAWIEEILPEARARIFVAQHLTSVGRLPEARAALDLGDALGLNGMVVDTLIHDDARARLELAALRPAAAREHTGRMLADPRFFATMRGGVALVASYLEEGRLREAEAALMQHADRQRDQGNLPDAVLFLLPALRLARWLDRPGPDPAHVAALAEILAEREDLAPHLRPEIRAELALRRGQDASSREAALRALEEAAERDAAEPMRRDQTLVLGLALTRAVRGARAAAALWQKTEQAPLRARRVASLDAALALEALGDVKGAEQAYLLAEAPNNTGEDAGQRMLAMARLALLYRRDKDGRADEAAKREAALDELWKKADPGLRDAVMKMR